MNLKVVLVMALVLFAFAATTIPVITSNLSIPAILNIAQIGNYSIDTGEVQPTGDPIDAPEPVEG